MWYMPQKYLASLRDRHFAHHTIMVALHYKACMMPFTIQPLLQYYCHVYIVNFVPNIIALTLCT